MKRRITSVFVIVAAALIAACGGNTEASVDELPVVTATPTATPTPTPELFETVREEEETVESDVDYDLTLMGKNMVYATVYQKMTVPDQYLGKTFRISGAYYDSYYEDTDTTYHFIVIADATACCSQGIEFMWEDESEEYPATGTELTVTGVFETYKEDGDENMYCHLVRCN